MIHASALDQVMKALTQEARATLSNATPQQEAVKRLEEVVRVHPYAVLFSDNTGRYIGANAAAAELTGFSRRVLALPAGRTPGRRQNPGSAGLQPCLEQPALDRNHH
jgi:hypothetical protein